MNDVIFYFVSLVIVYLLYLFLIILRKKKKNSYLDSTEFRYLITKYKLDKKKLNTNALTHVLAFSNAFIIATTVFVINFIDNLVLKTLVGFIVLLPLCLLVYHIIGKCLKKKERNDKNV